jgi:predicted amidohydrolase
MEATLVRVLRAAAAQMGPTQKADSREHTLARMLKLLEEAASGGAGLVVFPELAFTTFFPRWLLEGEMLDQYFERGMPNPAVQALFDRAHSARRLLCWLCRADAGWSPLQLRNPGRSRRRHSRPLSRGAFAGLDRAAAGRALPAARKKRYFEYGDLGFPASRAGSWGHAIMGMMIYNDRRWPESWRVLRLQGVELVCIGYNSAAYDPNGGAPEDAGLRTFHSTLVTQANAYMNATWAISVAKAGEEGGSGLIGGSCIVDPNGRIVAQAESLADEVIVADIDLDLCRQGKDKMFNFAAHRRPGAIPDDHRTRRRRRAGRSRRGLTSTRPVTALPKELT